MGHPGAYGKARHRGRLTAAAALACVPALAPGLAIADGDDGGFLGRLLNAVQSAAVKGAWDAVEPEVQSCLAGEYNLNPADLAAQNVPPNDPRVAPDIDTCRQAIAEGRYPAPQQDQQPQANVDPAEREKDLTAKYGRKAAKQIVAGNIDIGMNQDEVAAAWGDPGDRQQESNGKEKWLYGQDVVTFTHGKVTAVGH